MTRSSTLGLLAGLLSLFSIANAQTSTKCNPRFKKCPADPALGQNATFNWDQESANPQVWHPLAGKVDFSSGGGDFIIHGEGESVTLVSKFYIFFGQVSVLMQAASGQGIVSSIVMESDDLDEVDWELIGGNNSFVQSNYFGKGNTTLYNRAIWHPIDDPQGHVRNYTTNWTKDRLEWWIDGDLVRTLHYEDALGGKDYPQTPMTVRLGIWAGGDTKKNKPGVVKWAGGPTDFSQAPFTMNVQSVYVDDYSSGKKYVYGDHSGSWQSIKTINGTSSIADTINQPQNIEQEWQGLSSGAKIGIIVTAISVAVIGAGIITFCCIKQRKAGRLEHARLEAEYAREHAEMESYRRMMQNGDFAHGPV